jgi:hypothetical protein
MSSAGDDKPPYGRLGRVIAGVESANSESAAAAAGPAVADPIPLSPLAALWSGQILRDGELVLLMQRPSRWFILLSGLKFHAICAILMTLAVIYDERLANNARQFVELGVFAMAGRLMWSVLQWMSRLYILTDLRILRISGIFSVNVFECALRKVARTFLEVTVQERLCRIGSILIVPQDEDTPIGAWQMVSRPRRVHEKIVAAINRAKQGPHCYR